MAGITLGGEWLPSNKNFFDSQTNPAPGVQPQSPPPTAAGGGVENVRSVSAPVARPSGPGGSVGSSVSGGSSGRSSARRVASGALLAAALVAGTTGGAVAGSVLTVAHYKGALAPKTASAAPPAVGGSAAI